MTSFLLRQMLPFALVLTAAVLSSCGGSAPMGSQQALPSYNPAAHHFFSPPPMFLVSLPATNQIAYIDAVSEQISRIVTISFSPGEIAMHPISGIAYVVSGSNVTAYDWFNEKVDFSFGVPSGFAELAFGAGGNELYGLANGSILAYSSANGALLHTFSFSAAVTSFAEAGPHRFLFASISSLNEILVFDRSNGAVVHTIVEAKCGSNHPCDPDELVASSDGHYVLAVGGRNRNIISFYDSQTYRRVDRTSAGTGCKLDNGLFLDGVNLAANQAWYVTQCQVRRQSGLGFVAMQPPVGDSVVVPNRQSFGPYFGRLAFDSTGQKGLIVFSSSKGVGVMSVVGPSVLIYTQTSPAWIEYAP
jgi:hypothetical protein